MNPLNEQRLIAAVDMVRRAGAGSFEVGWTCPHVPDVADDHGCREVTWHAEATWRGAKLFVDRYRDPVAAAEALARRVQRAATCAHCDRRIAWGTRGRLRPMVCPWTTVDGRWEPGCTTGPKGGLR